MEIGAEVNIRFRIPRVGAELTRAEHRLPLVIGFKWISIMVPKVQKLQNPNDVEF